MVTKLEEEYVALTSFPRTFCYSIQIVGDKLRPQAGAVDNTNSLTTIEEYRKKLRRELKALKVLGLKNSEKQISKEISVARHYFTHHVTGPPPGELPVPVLSRDTTPTEIYSDKVRYESMLNKQLKSIGFLPCPLAAELVRGDLHYLRFLILDEVLPYEVWKDHLGGNKNNNMSKPVLDEVRRKLKRGTSLLNSKMEDLRYTKSFIKPFFKEVKAIFRNEWRVRDCEGLALVKNPKNLTTAYLTHLESFFGHASDILIKESWRMLRIVFREKLIPLQEEVEDFDEASLVSKELKSELKIMKHFEMDLSFAVNILKGAMEKVDAAFKKN